jgi:hypothetical protein
MQLANHSYGHIVWPLWRLPAWTRIVGAIALLLTLWTVCMHQASRPPRSLQPSSADYINASRDFVDHLLSFNANTVLRDQDRALKMMVDPDQVSERLEFLKRTRMITQARATDSVSYVDWRHAKVTVLAVTPQSTQVEIHTRLYINNELPRIVHMQLTLVPAARSETHPDGVGVLNWTELTSTEKS